MVNGRYLEKGGFKCYTQIKKEVGKGVYYRCYKCGAEFDTFKTIKAHKQREHSY